MTLTPLAALTALRERFPGRARLYVAGCTGEPNAMAEAFRADPELVSQITFLGVWVPGINAIDWSGLHETARAESIFLSPALRPSFDLGRTAIRPLSYTQAYPWLETTPMDAAIAMVSPPDENGLVSLGVSADFTGAPLSRAGVFKIALINPSMPAPKTTPRFPLDAFDLVAEADTPLLQFPMADLAPTYHQIAEHIAGLVEDGDTVQFGLGNIQQAVLQALTSHKNLRLHAGMISTPLLGLLDAGALQDSPGAIGTGIAIGTQALYARAAEDPRFRFAPVSWTHAIHTLSAIPKLKAVNSAIEVDLFGQANAEFIGGRQVSGAGGLVDFLRGAALSPGGRGVVALASTARDGTVSRIVPRLAPDATTITRADVETVVTEHGVADLRGKTIDARAEALISISALEFRSDLSNAWADMRRAL